MSHGKQYDLDLVRSAASTRWAEIVSNLANVDASILDGRHGPCPKCGGTDRFRFFTDGTGGAICNQCFRTKNGDGFSVLQWLKDRDFAAALADVADYLGIRPSVNGRSPGRRNGKAESDPTANLKWLPWDEGIVSLWCLHKPPITPAAVRQVGGRLARYRNQWTVIAVPIWGQRLQAADPVGWVLWNVSGGPLPTFTKGKISGWIHKGKVARGSKPGVIMEAMK